VPMRRGLAAAAIAALVLTSAGAAPGSSTQRLFGGVRNVSCAGPCSVPPHPPLYVGAGLAVKADRIGTDRVVAVRRPDDGTFGMRVAPGRYRVSAEVDGRCWRGSHRRVRVAGDPVHLRLTVANVCIR
jgi:hypothetical protein